MYFWSEIFKADSFEVKDVPVKFTCSYEPEQAYWEIAMLTKSNRLTGALYSEMYIKETWAGSEPYTYYLFTDIRYDFLSKRVISCEWGNADDRETENSYQVYTKYENGTIYNLEYIPLEGYDNSVYIAYEEKMQTQYQAFLPLIENAHDLNADYTAEYTRSVEKVWS